MATTMGVKLHWGATPALNKSIEIVDFPDLGGSPEMVDVTTLSDTKRKGIKGIDTIGALTFTSNYTKADYARLVIDAGVPLYYSLKLNDEEQFTWQGTHQVYVTGAGVNEVVRMKIVVVPSTRPVYVDDRD